MEHMEPIMMEPLEDVIGSVDCAQSAAHPCALGSVVVAKVEVKLESEKNNPHNDPEVWVEVVQRRARSRAWSWQRRGWQGLQQCQQCLQKFWY